MASRRPLSSEAVRQLGAALKYGPEALAITLEHLRMGALKGVILDADGSTLYDLYQEFEITPKVVNFALTTASTAAAFPDPPARGDEVTVGGAVYKVVDLEADAEGGLRLVLHFHRTV